MIGNREVKPEVIARQSKPFPRTVEMSRVDEIRDELLHDLQMEAERAKWEPGYEVNLMIGEVDPATNTVVIRAEAVPRHG